MRSLAKLKEGACARLVGFSNTNASYRRRLLAHGLAIGTCVRVLSRVPLGGAIVLGVHGMKLVLREKEMRDLQWEPIR